MGKPRGLLYGIGVNDVAAPIRTIQTEYMRWVYIMNNCFGPNSKKLDPKPKMDERWLSFSNFLSWLYEQPNWRDYEVHKGIKEVGCVTYSPDTCVMLNPAIRRILFSTSNGKPGNYHGVSVIQRAIDKGQRPYYAQGRAINGKQNVSLGTYWTAEEAHRAWQMDKIEHLLECLPWSENEYVTRRINSEIQRLRNDIKLNRITEWPL